MVGLLAYLLPYISCICIIQKKIKKKGAKRLIGIIRSAMEHKPAETTTINPSCVSTMHTECRSGLPVTGRM